MLKFTPVAAASVALIALTGSAGAHDTYTIDKLRAEQLRQIEAGRYSGELTRREYRELLAEQGRIAEMERAALADGYVNGREFRTIREAQREAARRIDEDSRDNQISFWRRWLYRNRY
jgi:hypothetical protein